MTSDGPTTRVLPFTKAHAYGNDFLFVEAGALGVESRGDADLARAICDRHSGLGADGLIIYEPSSRGASMRLFNADGSVAEVSGNGVRCLGALLVEDVPAAASWPRLTVETAGGIKTLELVAASPPRATFRADMGAPADVCQRVLDVDGETVPVVVLSMGNPQCVVLTDELDDNRFRRLGPLLATHAAFPAGTNVEFVHVRDSHTLQILIWERGVGPTTASGTGACASAVAAASFGGADQDLDVTSPGGTQRVEWHGGAVHLTGWAEVIARGEWRGV